MLAIAFVAGYQMGRREFEFADKVSVTYINGVGYSDLLAVHVLVDSNEKLIGVFKIQNLAGYVSPKEYKKSYDDFNKESNQRVFLLTVTPPRAQ